jgi:hypothetical protein
VKTRTISGRLGGCFGLASAGLLAGSLVWAHHWNPRADTIVAAWALTTLGALWFSVQSLRASHASFEVAPALAKIGIWLAAISVLALAVAGIAAAAGMNPAGACGGG